jgi:hypothetical protein
VIPPRKAKKIKKVRFGTDDCMGSLVDRCKCRQDQCTAHAEFGQWSQDMQQVRKLQKAYSEEELTKMAQVMDEVFEESRQARYQEDSTDKLQHRRQAKSTDKLQQSTDKLQHRRQAKSTDKLQQSTDKLQHRRQAKSTDKLQHCAALQHAGFIANLTPAEFEEQAQLTRMQCEAELHSNAAAHKNTPTQTLMLDKPINALPVQGKFDDGWRRLSVAVDSGAAETVIPYNEVKEYPVTATEASRSGLNYASATGDPIPNLGEQRLPLCTQEGTLRSMTFQAAPVSRALGSVMRMCRAGHKCVFDDEGSYIENKNTGEVNWLREEDGNYMLDVWVAPNEATGFGGQR